jgi:transcriptional regulator with XRE-family HTH domain
LKIFVSSWTLRISYSSTSITMQAVFITPQSLFKNTPYDADMHPGGRPTRKPRSTLGQRLAEARERAGISQTELAEKLRTVQPSIAYWERNAVNLRSDVIIKLIQILGISADELLGTRPPRQIATKPVGKARQVFHAVSRLPRRQQEKILEVVQAFVNQQGNGQKQAA